MGGNNYRYVFRWETPDGYGPMAHCKREYSYVFISMSSALMWLRELGRGYDNPSHSDLVLCLYKATECYPVDQDIGTRDEPHSSFSNGISLFCNEYSARIWDRTPIAYMEYKDIETFGKQLSKCKSKKAISEFLDLPKNTLDADSVIISKASNVWKRWTQYGKWELISHE